MRKFLCSPIIAVLSVIASCQATDNVSKSKLNDVVGELSGKFPYLEELGMLKERGVGERFLNSVFTHSFGCTTGI